MPASPLVAAGGRVMDSWAAMLHGYRLDPADHVDALRMLRSLVHGFGTLEASGSFQIDVSVDDSFTWMIDVADRGLQSLGTSRREAS